MQDLRDKVALVTGGGQGVGFGIAMALAGAGARLVLVEWNQARLDGSARQLREAGHDVLPVLGDVRDRAAAIDAVERALVAFGRLDILVNNAQILAPPMPFVDQDDAHIHGIVESGLYGTIHFMQAAYPALKRDGGAVINLGSGAGAIGNIGQASYAATKEAIRGLSRVAAREWGRDGIRVNVICPAANSPSMTAWFAERPEELEALLAQTALNRFAEPFEDIGQLVVFLASPDCFLTGQTLFIDGGQLMA